MHGGTEARGGARTLVRAFVRSACCIRAFCICAFFRLSSWPSSPTRARTEALARQAAERLQVLQKEADELAAQEQTLLGDLRRLEVEREIKAVELKQADAEVRDVSARLAATGDEMQRLERQEAAERPGLEQRLVETYKLGRGRYLRMLLSTSDIRRVGQATRTVAALAHIDRDRVADAPADARAAEDAARRARGAPAPGDRRPRRRQARGRTRSRARRRRATRSSRTSTAGATSNAQFTGELQAAQQKLQAALRNLAAGDAGRSGRVLPLAPVPRRSRPGRWPARCASGSAARPARASTSSNGMEIAAAEGTAVAAVHDGVVAFADSVHRIRESGHPGPRRQGVHALRQPAGDRRQEGRPGRARPDRSAPSAPPPAGQPGLYFELRVDGQPVDPLQWLKKR